MKAAGQILEENGEVPVGGNRLGDLQQGAIQLVGGRVGPDTIGVFAHPIENSTRPDRASSQEALVEAWDQVSHHSLPDKLEIARRVSPLSYVRKDNPPIITIHGDADNVVPYSHAVRLHQALDKAGVPNELFTVKGGGHGQFSDEDNREAYSAVWLFLAKHHLGPVKTTQVAK